MIFGFGRKKSAGDFLAAAGIYQAFERLQRDCPGAGYIFARAITNARPLLGAGMSDHRRRAEIDRAIKAATPHSRADGGMSLLALQVLQQAAASTDEAARSTYFSSCEKISEHGRKYREIDENDYEIPLDLDDAALVKRMGGESLGHCIELLEIEAKGTSLSELQETIDTLVATYDIRDEIRSGALPPHIRNIQMILALKNG
jgi:hypothetical protein